MINSFTLSELETGLNDDLEAFVNAVGVSDSVVLFSIGNPGYGSWSANVKSKLGELGIGLTDLDALQAGEPVIIFGRKGAIPGTAKITRALLSPASEQVITVNESITGRNTEGFMKSVIIGPASEWKQFVSKAHLEPEDQITFSVYGVSLDGSEVCAVQTNISNINQETLGNILIDLPNFSTQQKIAAVLSALDAKIELNARINAELESMAKTLYDYWFVQFAPHKSAGGKMVWNDELKREIPLGWEVKDLEFFGSFKNGINYDPKIKTNFA